MHMLANQSVHQCSWPSIVQERIDAHARKSKGFREFSLAQPEVKLRMGTRLEGTERLSKYVIESSKRFWC
jgi:hypothetical protein